MALLALPAALVWLFLATTSVAAQSQTVERWVDAILGNDSRNCTRAIEEGEEEGDPDVYIYNSCRTIARALAVAGPNDVIRVTGGTFSLPLTVDKPLTIIGGYLPGFGQQIEPPNFPNFQITTINGANLGTALSIRGQALTLIDPSITGEPPMSVTLRDLRISGGNNSGLVIFSAGSGFPPTAPNRVNVTLDNVTIFGNSGAQGGGIRITGNGNRLTLNRSSVQNNTASSAGGGIYVSGGALLTVGDNTQISGNNAGGGNGGGIALSGALTVTLSGFTLTTNSAANGGALHVANTPLELGSDSVILSNSAINGGGVFIASGSPVLGSALFQQNNASNHGGGIYVNSGNPTIVALTLLTNTASNGGGGIYLNGGSPQLSGLTLQGNRAGGGHGGGIHLAGGNATLTGNAYSNNQATNGRGGGLYGAGGALSAAGESFVGNRAQLGGGAAFAGVPGATINTPNFSENHATQNGGGLYVEGGGALTLNSPSFNSNSSDGRGAGLYLTNRTLNVLGTAQFLGNQASGQGGALFLAAGGIAAFNGLELIDNVAAAGGGIYREAGSFSIAGAASFLGNQATTGNGGALYLSGGGSAASLVTLTAQNNEAVNGGVLFADGVALTLGRVDLQSNAATGNGGAIYLSNATLTVTDTATLIDNQAGQSGGALFATGSNLTLVLGGNVRANRAEGATGGGIYLHSPGSANLGQLTLFENLAATHGGGLYAEGLAVTLVAGSQIARNSAQGGAGGGLYVTGSSLTLNGVQLTQNEAFIEGAGFYATGGAVTLAAGTTLQGNRTFIGRGGGGYVVNSPNLTLAKVTFTNNEAETDGGGLAILNSTMTALQLPGPPPDGATFNNNRAKGRGGALYVEGGALTLRQVTVEDNQAAQGGGGIYAVTGPFSLADSLLRQNDAGAAAGGALYLQASAADFSANTFHENRAVVGAGLHLVNTPLARFNSDIWLDNLAAETGGGLALRNSRAELDRAVVRGNRADLGGGGLHALYSTVGVTNTLVVRNQAGSVAAYAAGVYLGNSTLRGEHVTLADNSHADPQGVAGGLVAATPLAGSPPNSTVTLRNSIVSGQNVGVDLAAGNNAMLTAILWDNSGFDWTGNGTFTVSGSVRGNPAFLNASSGDYRIRRTSAAFDRGLVGLVPADRDGIARTQGFAPDLGAHEHRYAAGLYLRTTTTRDDAAPFVHPGDPLRITVQIRNQSNETARNVFLTANLPAQLPAPTMQPGGCQGIFCQADLGDIPPGSEVTVVIQVAVAGEPSADGLVNLNSNLTLATTNFSESDTAGISRAWLHGCRAETGGVVYPSVQAAVDAAPSGTTVRVSGVCGDLHRNGGPGQLLALDKALTLEGGWNSDFTVFDPAAHPTILDAAEQGRVLYMDATVAPTFAHMTLRGGSAAGLGGGPAGKDAGGAVYLRRATPTFTQVEIATSYSPDLGGGVYVGSGATSTPTADAPGPRFQRGGILSNRAGERGGGVYADYALPRFDGVSISRNQARAGGGLYLHNSPARFSEPAAPSAPPTCRLDGNLATGVPRYVPSAPPVIWRTPGGGGALASDVSALDLRRCVVAGNQAMVGGGLYLHGTPTGGVATVENNWITGNFAMPGTLVGPGDVRSGDGGGVVVDNLNPAQLLFRGNLLALNDATRGAALLTRLAHSGALVLPHFSIHNNLGGPTIVALGESRLQFADTIVAFNQTGVTIQALVGPNGESASIEMTRTLWEPPSQQPDGGDFLRLEDNFNGDPAFKNDGYHIKRISAGYGLGTSLPAFADRDGNPRPVGAAADLGADEYADPAIVRYVAVGGTGDAPCTDFRFPCPTLQLALDAASDGDLIKMAGGTFTGVRNDDGRIHHARVVKNVTIQGGYFPRTDDNAVTEGLFTDHDWEDPHPDLNPTVIDVANQGRGFWISDGATPVIASITIRRGNASALGDGPAGSSGGAGGGIFVENAAPILRDVIVQESTAVYGGGLYLATAGGDYRGLLLTNNQATWGGGLYVEGGAPLVEGVTLQANRAITGAGAVVDGGSATLRANTLLDNGDASTLDGGGLAVLGGAATVSANTLRGNLALRGGGLYVRDFIGLVRENLIEENRAGALPPVDGQDAALGGGLYVLGGAPLIEANVVRANQARHPAVAHGGGVYLRTLGATEQPLRWRANTVEANTAHRGAGLFVTLTDGDIEVQDNTVRDNRATAADNSIRQIGGGLYVTGSGAGRALLTGNTVTANQAVLGAGLAVQGATRHEVHDNTLAANVAAQDGGGLYLDAANLSLATNTVVENVAQTGRGGGLYATGGAATLFANTVAANRAGLEGGGIYLRDDAASLRGGLLFNNRAADGGGVFIQGPLPDSPAPHLEQVTVQGNTAGNHGGGLFLLETNARIIRSTILDNQAAADGGGAYIENSAPADFSANLIRNNQAGERGGGLLLIRGSRGLYLSNAVVDNRGLGGGITVVGAEVSLVHTTLARNGTGLQVEPLNQVRGRVALTNSIIAGHTLGVLVQPQAEVTLLATLWDGNTTQNSGPGSFSNLEARTGAAAFAEDGIRLSLGSAAVSAGVRGDFSTGIDLDGEARFQGSGPELGADELTAPCAVVVNENTNQVFDVLQQAIDAAPSGAELRLAGTCRDLFVRDGAAQVAYIAKPLTLRGGFRADAGPAGWQTPDPTRFPTVLDARGAGRVMRIVDVRVALEGLILLNGSAAGLGGGAQGEDAGGVIYARSSNFSLTDVEIGGGVAHSGAGLYWRAPTLGGGATVNIVGSSMRNNRAAGQGGGAYVLRPVGNVRLQDNRFTDNAARDGAGLFITGGEAIVLANRFARNQANPSDGRGGALHLVDGAGSVNRNHVADNGAALGGGFYIAGGAPALTNNIFTANRGGQTGAALYLEQVAIDVRHNTLVDNRAGNPAGAAVTVDAPERTTALTNNILTDHARAVFATDGTILQLRTNLWHNNSINWEGGVQIGAGNLFEPPGFVDAAAGDFRLAETSAAIDRGQNAGVSDDFDGQTRPARQGYDIGADELQRASLNATVTALPPVVAAGEQATLVIQVINNGDVDVNATIAVTLPASLTPLGPTSWNNIALVRGAVWTENLTVRVAAGASGILPLAMGVNSTQGATARADASITVATVTGQTLETIVEVLPAPVVPGSTVEYRVSVANRGATNLAATVRAELPEGVATAGPLVWTPTIAGPGGQWSTSFTATIPAGRTQDLDARVVVTSLQGVSSITSLSTPLARPGIAVSRSASPRPVRAGDLLVYQVTVTNTGNIPLNATVVNVFPPQVALPNPSDGAVWRVPLAPGAIFSRAVTTTVEAAYIGPLSGSVRAEAGAGITGGADDVVESIAATLVPTARAKGGDWYDPATWEPPGLPSPNDVVEIPAGVEVFSLRPVTVTGLINLGTLEMRNVADTSQELTVLDLLHNRGEIRGTPGRENGAAGLRLNMQTGLLLNDGIIRAGDGAQGSGPGGDLFINARAAANNGLLAAGNGGDALAGTDNPDGGPGGEVVIALNPGLFTNSGRVVAGNGGASESGAQPPVQGAPGGNITIISTAAARLTGGEFIAGLGGAGSSGGPFGTPGGLGRSGTVVVGAPTIATGTTQFRPAAPTLIRGEDPAPNFTAVAPTTIRLNAAGIADFPVRIINRGAQRDTYVISFLDMPKGWQLPTLPTTAAVTAFNSGDTPVRLSVPLALLPAQGSSVETASFHRFTILVTSQSPGVGQVVLPMHVETDRLGINRIRLPLIFR